MEAAERLSTAVDRLLAAVAEAGPDLPVRLAESPEDRK